MLLVMTPPRLSITLFFGLLALHKLCSDQENLLDISDGWTDTVEQSGWRDEMCSMETFSLTGLPILHTRTRARMYTLVLQIQEPSLV